MKQDHDNPEWTRQDFKRSHAPEDVLPEDVLSAFKKSAGRPLGSGKKEAIHMRLSHDVLSYFRQTGPGWQTRIDNLLSQVINPSSSLHREYLKSLKEKIQS